ncbi:hypothetical protein PG996_003173 [Apiospora saccharicola]|uniref:Uncharacterized protein n=1 Tax=Apiospora saccharicola TaxID=335842 RepID=A0ABR1W0J8_9PEZI
MGPSTIQPKAVGVRITLSEPPRFSVIPEDSAAERSIVRCADPTRKKVGSTHLSHGFEPDDGGRGHLQKQMAQLHRLPAFKNLDGSSRVDESGIKIPPGFNWADKRARIQKVNDDFDPGTTAEAMSQWCLQMRTDGKSDFTSVESPPEGTVGDETGEDWFHERYGLPDVKTLCAFEHLHKGIDKQNYLDNPPTMNFFLDTWPPACTTCKALAYICDCQSGVR